MKFLSSRGTAFDAEEFFRIVSDQVSVFVELDRDQYVVPDRDSLDDESPGNAFIQVFNYFIKMLRDRFTYPGMSDITQNRTLSPEEAAHHFIRVFNAAHLLSLDTDWSSQREKDRDILIVIFQKVYIPAFLAALSGGNFREVFTKQLYYIAYPEKTPN